GRRRVPVELLGHRDSGHLHPPAAPPARGDAARRLQLRVLVRRGAAGQGAGLDASLRPRRDAGLPVTAMKRSTERILTTHVGSLSRPDALIPFLRAIERAQPYDREHYAALVRETVADVVRRQTEAGIDVPTDGEQSKPSFFGYVVERFSGFE